MIRLILITITIIGMVAGMFLTQTPNEILMITMTLLMALELMKITTIGNMTKTVSRNTITVFGIVVLILSLAVHYIIHNVFNTQMDSHLFVQTGITLLLSSTFMGGLPRALEYISPFDEDDEDDD